MVGSAQVVLLTRAPVSSRSLALALNSLLEFHLSTSRLSSGPLPHPHLCERECCLGICSKKIAKSRNTNENYLAGASPGQLSSVLGYRSLPHSLQGRCYPVIRPGTRFLLHLFPDFPDPVFLDMCRVSKDNIKSIYHRPWLTGDFAVMLTELEFPGCLCTATPSKALWGP